MTKTQWDRKLKKKLAPLGKDEQRRICDYYDELYNDKKDAGLSEEEILAEFGAPEEAAAKFIEEEGGKKDSGNPVARFFLAAVLFLFVGIPPAHRAYFPRGGGFGGFRQRLCRHCGGGGGFRLLCRADVHVRRKRRIRGAPRHRAGGGRHRLPAHTALPVFHKKTVYPLRKTVCRDGAVYPRQKEKGDELTWKRK